MSTICLLDGGTGSEVDRIVGHTTGSKHWSALFHAQHPTVLRSVHAAFAQAGARIVTANTYAVLQHLLGCADEDIGRSVDAAVRMARDACAGVAGVRIAGSLSAHASDDVEEGVLTTSLLLTARALSRAEVDCVFVEMIQCPRVGALLVSAAAKIDKPLFLGFSVAVNDAGVLVFRRSNEPFEERAVHRLCRLAGVRVTCVGIMHSDSELLERGLRVLERVWDGDLMIYPDSGRFVDNAWVSEGARHCALVVDRVRRACRAHPTIRYVGGCCGLGPAYIRALATMLQQGHGTVHSPHASPCSSATVV